MKPTLKQMATEINAWYKENGVPIQWSVSGKRIIYVDYSIVIKRKEYGIAPIYVDTSTSKQLRREYAQYLRKQEEKQTAKTNKED